MLLLRVTGLLFIIFTLTVVVEENGKVSTDKIQKIPY